MNDPLEQFTEKQVEPDVFDYIAERDDSEIKSEYDRLIWEARHRTMYKEYFRDLEDIQQAFYYIERCARVAKDATENLIRITNEKNQSMTEQPHFFTSTTTGEQ